MTVQRFKVQQSHSDSMLMTAAVDDLASSINFVRFGLSVHDLHLVSVSSTLWRIYQNVAKLVYLVTKQA